MQLLGAWKFLKYNLSWKWFRDVRNAAKSTTLVKSSCWPLWQDHPLLHRPWFTLHPCGTNEIMRLVFSDFLLRGKKDTVFVSEQLEELSGISAVSEKQATCESLIGRAEITTSERSMKWENPEERFASWIEKYVLTWMSFACPAVGLAIPLRLFVDSKWSM